MIKIAGDQEIIRKLSRYGDAVQAEVRKAIERTAIQVRGDAVKSVLQGPKSGVVYTRAPGQNLSRTHKASAPGEAPASDTGRLASSITYKMDKQSAVVGSTITQPAYPKFLEFGTVNMEARPFLRPALDRNADKYLERLRKVHDDAVRSV